MTTKPPQRLQDPDDDRFEDFIRAGIWDLGQIFEARTWGSGHMRDTSRLPAVPQVAQLSVFLLLVLKGAEPKHRNVFANLERLNWHLNKVYTASKQCWLKAREAKTPKAQKARLQDTSEIEPLSRALLRFADTKIGLTPTSLSAYGVTDVQVALSHLIRRTTGVIGKEMGMPWFGSGPAKLSASKKSARISTDVPDPVLGGLLVAAVGADVGLTGNVTRDQAMAIRAGVGIGTGPKSPAKPENAEVKRLRRTLEELADYLGDGAT
jgi:hypothetical protein